MMNVAPKMTVAATKVGSPTGGCCSSSSSGGDCSEPRVCGVNQTHQHNHHHDHNDDENNNHHPTPHHDRNHHHDDNHHDDNHHDEKEHNPHDVAHHSQGESHHYHHGHQDENHGCHHHAKEHTTPNEVHHHDKGHSQQRKPNEEHQQKEGHHHDNHRAMEEKPKVDGHRENGHDHGHSHVHKEEEDHDHEDNGVLCLAVVQENGADISLFDAAGDVRCFSYKGDIRKLCFSSHGQNADDLLTPCFDEDGNHGTPDEGCFCGVDTPHLHAHVHDPRMCSEDQHSTTIAGAESDLMKLASLTLFPTDDDGEEFTPVKDRLLQIPLSERMPKECNSKDLVRHMSSGGINQSEHSVRNRRMHQVKHGDHVDYLVHSSSTGDLHLEHPNCEDCGGINDYHGSFRCVGRRRLNQTGNDVRLHFFEVSHRRFSFMNLFEPESGRVTAFRQEALKMPSRKVVAKEPGGCCSGGTCSKPSEKVPTKKKPTTTCCSGGTCSKGTQMEKPKPTCCSSGARETAKVEKSSCCSSGKCGTDPPKEAPKCRTENKVGISVEKEAKSCCSRGTCSKTSSDVASATEVSVGVDAAEQHGNAVRSSFHCTQICCASEVPMINSILEPLEGVTRITINVPLKTVMVDHHHVTLSARDIEEVLNRHRFGASLKKDGGVSSKQKTSGRSSFYVAKICCASEIPAINAIIDPMKGTSKISISVTTKMVYVDHDTVIVSADAICDALNAEGFNARVESDAGTQTGTMSAYVTSTIALEDSEVEIPTMEELTAFLKTMDKSQLQTFVVDVPSKTITVVHNPFFLSAESLLERLRDKTGLRGRLAVDGAAKQVWDFPRLVEEETIEETTAGVRPTVILSGIFWIISMLSFIGGNWEHLKYVALLSVVFGLPPIGLKAFRTLRRFQFDSNCLMFFAALGAVALQEFTEAAAVTFLFAISEWLEVRATARARKALSEIVSLKPENANLVHPTTGEIVVVPAVSVPLGALVSVRTGDKIPCDGVVVEGRSTVDESSLTGESRPVRKEPKDQVSGGTINSGHTQMMVRTTSTADDSAVARLIRLVEEAQANRSDTEKLVDEFARVYTPIVVFSAFLMCTIPWFWGREIGGEWTHNGLVLIVIACPCAVIISTPVAYVAGLAATAQKGILIKGGAHLESLGLVKKVCFDKTGTLTQGKFQLLHLNVIGEKRTRKEVLEFLSLMEERASHPLAQAIVDAARNEGVSIPKALYVQDHTFLAGEGVSGVIDGSAVYVGNFRLFERLGLLRVLPETEKKKVESWEQAGGTVGFISIEGNGIVCSYCVADAVRPESAEVVGKLNRMGVEVTMLTGDNHDAALAIGRQVGLSGEEIKDQLLPEEKLSIVTGMKDSRSGGQSIFANIFSSKRTVLMCGDGVNDAPALAIADVGVAMGAGAALAMETADVTLLDSHLSKLVYSIRMGRRVIRKIKENVVFSLAVKFIVLGFALNGKAQLWAAIASDVGAMIIVTLNGMMLLPSIRTDVAASDKDGSLHDLDSDECSA